MNMICFTASEGAVRDGISASWFPHHTQGPLMAAAAIGVRVHEDVDVKRMAELASAGDPSLYAFGDARLLPCEPGAGLDPAHCLMAVDLSEFWPDGNLGDKSQLVVLDSSGKAVLKATRDRLYLSNGTLVLVWPADRDPELVDRSSLSEAERANVREAEAAAPGVRTLRVSG